MIVVSEHSATAPPVARTARPDAAAPLEPVAQVDVDAVVDADAEGDRQRDEVEEVGAHADPRRRAEHPQHARRPACRSPAPRRAGRAPAPITSSATPRSEAPVASGASCSIERIIDGEDHRVARRAHHRAVVERDLADEVGDAHEVAAVPHRDVLVVIDEHDRGRACRPISVKGARISRGRSSSATGARSSGGRSSRSSLALVVVERAAAPGRR